MGFQLGGGSENMRACEVAPRPAQGPRSCASIFKSLEAHSKVTPQMTERVAGPSLLC